MRWKHNYHFESFVSVARYNKSSYYNSFRYRVKLRTDLTNLQNKHYSMLHVAVSLRAKTFSGGKEKLWQRLLYVKRVGFLKSMNSSISIKEPFSIIITIDDGSNQIYISRHHYHQIKVPVAGIKKIQFLIFFLTLPCCGMSPVSWVQFT